MNVKRNSAVLGVTVALSLAVAACGGGGSSGGGGDMTGKASGEINYWLWDSNQKPAYDACAAAFTKANPDIKVKIEQYGWDDYWGKLQTGFVSKTAPDVFTNHLSKYPEFAQNNQMSPINDAVSKDGVDLSQYQPGLAALWVDENGDRMGLPKDWDTTAIFYNSKMIADAALTDQMGTLAWNPTDGGTYEQAIAKLTVDKNGVHGDQPGFDKNNVAVYGLGYPGAGSWFGQTEWAMYALGNDWTYTDKNPWGTKFSYDDPKFVETIAWFRTLIDKGYAPPLAAATGGVGMNELFGAGKYAMVIDGDWNIGSYLDQSGVKTAFAPTPIGPSGKRASVFNGLADSIYAGSDNQAAAWQWVKFLASPDGQDIVAGKGVVFPAIKEALPKAVAAFKSRGVDVTPFTVQVKERTTHLAPITYNSAEIDKIMAPAMEEIYAGKADPASKLKDANAQVNALFN